MAIHAWQRHTPKHGKSKAVSLWRVGAVPSSCALADITNPSGTSLSAWLGPQTLSFCALNCHPQMSRVDRYVKTHSPSLPKRMYFIMGRIGS